MKFVKRVSLKEDRKNAPLFPTEDNLSAGVKDKLNTVIKDWYIEAFPNDELGPDLIDGFTFKDLFDDLSKGVFGYECCADDSVVRERVFFELSQILGVEYDAIYYKWIDSEDKNESLKESKELKEDFPIISRIDWSKLERLINKELTDRAKEVDGFQLFENDISFDTKGRTIIPFEVELKGKGKWFKGSLASSEDMKEIVVYTKDLGSNLILGNTHHFEDIVDLLIEFINKKYGDNSDSKPFIPKNHTRHGLGN